MLVLQKCIGKYSLEENIPMWNGVKFPKVCKCVTFEKYLYCPGQGNRRKCSTSTVLADTSRSYTFPVVKSSS